MLSEKQKLINLQTISFHTQMSLYKQAHSFVCSEIAALIVDGTLTEENFNKWAQSFGKFPEKRFSLSIEKIRECLEDQKKILPKG